MIRNYIKIGLRNLRKQPANTFIHIFGLAIGLVAFLLISDYRAFERSFDDFHPEPDRLYRLTTDDVLEGRIQVRDAMSFAPSGKALEDDLVEVVNHCTTYKTWRMIFRKDGQPVEETGVIAADTNFFKLFGYEIVEGDENAMLRDPYSIVLTRSQANKYFGNVDAMGQSIHVLGSFDRPFQVTGIIEDIPRNTHYSFDMLVSLGSFQQRIDSDAWNGFNYYTYLQLGANADIEAVRSQLPALSRKYLGDDSRLEFNLQPVRDIHLHSDFTFEPEIHGSAKAVYFLGLISILILLIAWVNYVNLSTARALERAKEVGLRKVVGAQRRQLLNQFLFEALIINLSAGVIAAVLAQVLLPYFNQLVGKAVLTTIWTNPQFLSKLFLFCILGTLVTGFYPALVLSSFKPISVLRGSFGRSRQGVWLRKTLVVIQFAASLMLIASTVIIYQQIRYMTGKDLGIDIAQVIGINNPSRGNLDEEAFTTRYRAFADELTNQTGVAKVGAIANLPGGGSADISSTSGGVKIIGLSDRVESTVYVSSMNDRLKDALSLEWVAGRNFDHELLTDTSAVVVNQALLDLLQVSDPDLVLNQFLQFGRDPENDRFPIVGVVSNYNRSSLKNHVEPTVFFHDETPSHTVVKLEADDLAGAIARVGDLWNQFFPQSPFVYSFLDHRFARLYEEDRKFGFIFFNFALLAILVASMGLFGLSSYMAIQRTKEVGIRKVLGASVGNIVVLFFKDFLWLIGIAVVIGIPAVYLGMSDWLDGYTYRIKFPWWVLVVAVLGVAALAFITVSFQTWKVALLNPAQTVRDE